MSGQISIDNVINSQLCACVSDVITQGREENDTTTTTIIKRPHPLLLFFELRSPNSPIGMCARVCFIDYLAYVCLHIGPELCAQLRPSLLQLHPQRVEQAHCACALKRLQLLLRLSLSNDDRAMPGRNWALFALVWFRFQSRAERLQTRVRSRELERSSVKSERAMLFGFDKLGLGALIENSRLSIAIVLNSSFFFFPNRR